MMPGERRRKSEHDNAVIQRRHLLMLMFTMPVWVTGWVNIINWWLL